MLPILEVTSVQIVKCQIEFIDIKEEYPMNKISCSYKVAKGFCVRPEDWIGLFQKGRGRLAERIDYEYQEDSSKIEEVFSCYYSINEEMLENKISFSSDYYFLYVTEKWEVVGMSPYFRLAAAILELPSAPEPCKIDAEKEYQNEIAKIKSELDLVKKTLTEEKQIRANMESRLETYNFVMKDILPTLIPEPYKTMTQGMMRLLGWKEPENHAVMKLNPCDPALSNELVKVVPSEDLPANNDNIEIIH